MITFNFVCLAWIFFRSPDFYSSIDYLKAIIKMNQIAELRLDPYAIIRLLPCMVLLLLIEIQQYHYRIHTFLKQKSFSHQFAYFLSMILLIFILGSFDKEMPFIYFQF